MKLYKEDGMIDNSLYELDSVGTPPLLVLIFFGGILWGMVGIFGYYAGDYWTKIALHLMGAQ